MQELWPIYIPSKGRPRGKSFATLGDIPYTVFVEPQDMADYGSHSSVVRVGANGRGLVYARNAIVDAAVAAGHGWIWMLDDDIFEFGFVRRGRVVAASPREVLTEAQSVIDQPIAGCGCLAYRQYAWKNTLHRPCSYHTRCEVAVCINVKKMRGMRYDIETKEDKDMVAQFHAKGLVSIMSNLTAFGSHCGLSRVAKGGHDMAYASRRDEVAAQEVKAKWGEGARMTINGAGRVDVRLDYRGIYASAKRQ